MMTFFGYEKTLFAQLCAFQVKLDTCSHFSNQKDIFAQLYVFQGKAGHLLTFFKSKRHFLQDCVLFKAKLHSSSPFSSAKDAFCRAVCFSRQIFTASHLFQVKKTLFAKLYDFQGKVLQVLTFFKPERHFLHSCILFKAKLHRCSPFSNQKDTFCTVVYF